MASWFILSRNRAMGAPQLIARGSCGAERTFRWLEYSCTRHHQRHSSRPLRSVSMARRDPPLELRRSRNNGPDSSTTLEYIGLKAGGSGVAVPGEEAPQSPEIAEPSKVAIVEAEMRTV